MLEFKLRISHVEFGKKNRGMQNLFCLASKDEFFFDMKMIWNFGLFWTTPLRNQLMFSPQTREL